MLIRNNKTRFAAVLLAVFSTASTAMAQGTGESGISSAARSQMWMSVGFYALLLLTAALILGVIGRVLKVFELSTDAAGAKKGINWNAFNGTLFLIIGFLGLYGAFWEFTHHGKMILPEPASSHGVVTDQLLHTTFYITFAVFVITHIILFTYTFFYRHRKGVKAYYYSHNDNLEKVWTLIPAVVLSILVFFGWKAWTDIMYPKDLENTLKVEAVAEQFKWNIRYAGKDNLLGPKNYRLIGGDNPLGVKFDDSTSHDDFFPTEIVLPVNKQVQFQFGAKDVLHSAYMPHFRVQMNCVPGMNTYFAFTPTITTNEMRSKLNDAKFEYLLYCNKICGGAHYNMKMTIRVVSDKEYKEWLKQDAQQAFWLKKNAPPVKADPTSTPVDTLAGPKTVAININK